MRRSRDTPLTQDIRQIGHTQYTRTVTPDGSHGEGSTGYAFAKSGGRNRPRMVCHGRRKATFCGGFPFSLVGACRPSSTKRGYPLAPDFDHGLACAFAEFFMRAIPPPLVEGCIYLPHFALTAVWLIVILGLFNASTAAKESPRGLPPLERPPGDN